MVHFFKMTQLVHDDVVGQSRGKEGDSIIEIEISLARATSPARGLVLDTHGIEGEMVDRIEMLYTRVNEGERCVFVMSERLRIAYGFFATHGKGDTDTA